MPKGLPTQRWYVNRGSRTYVECITHVPIPPPKELAFVDKAVRETSLKTLNALPETLPPGSGPEEQPPDSGSQKQQADGPTDGQTQGAMEAPSTHDLQKHLKKRKLYRQATDTMEVWFPHDNAEDLLKELVWEAGGSDVKWVCHGTPAAGNGIVGLLEMGCNVLAVCQDDHYKTHFMKAAVEKAAETCLSGFSVTFGYLTEGL